MKSLYLSALAAILFCSSCANKPKPVTPVVDIKDENACWEYFKGKQFKYDKWGIAFDDKNKVSFYNLDVPLEKAADGKFLLRTGYLEVGDMYYTYSRNLTIHPSRDLDMKIRLSDDGTFLDQSNFEKYEVAKF